MNCMRCGKNTEEKQFFCPSCLESMEKHPVKPGTVVQLPIRPAAPPAPKKTSPPPKTVTPEEKIEKLQGAIRILALILIAALVAFGITACLLIKTLENRQEESKPLGRNYSMSQTAETDPRI